MRTTIHILLLIFSGVLFLSFQSCNTEFKPILPEQKVVKVRSIFKKEQEKTVDDYDLEETIRIIHGLDKGRKESKSFDAYLEFMASQDYTNVAPDIIKAKLKLLPILDKLMKAERKLEEADELWTTFSGISEVVVDDVAILGVTAVVTGGFSPDLAPNFINMGKNSFKAIEEQKKLKEEIKEEVEAVKDDYINYLHNFVPVYLKYMNEWDRLCLKRDNAYLEIHQGNIDAALLSLEDVLKIDPVNKEALILKSFSLLVKEQNNQTNKPSRGLAVEEQGKNLPITMKDDQEIMENIETDSLDTGISYGDQAKEILDNYIEANPDRSAPALLLLGTYNFLEGDEEKAVSLFNQSAVEYPRQSHVLLDMLNSYKQRTYLRKSAEGSYILELYKSTMEGFGFFSPNFQKAMIESNKYDFESAKDEILRHFFRRGNQDVYDYMISDMMHCENYLPESFNLIFREKSLLDLEATSKMFSSEKLNIKIKNRSDVKLSNVRVFLCLHFTDMYKDDYEVFKVNTTVNNIEPHSVADFGDVKIDFELYGKKKDVDKDIVTARAIIVTDDIVSWVDEENFKITRIKGNNEYYDNLNGSSDRFNEYQNSLGLKWEELNKLIEDEAKFEVKTSYLGKDNIRIKLPRTLVQLNPLFSINELSLNETVLPSSYKLNGPAIELEFEHNLPKDEELNLFLTSKNLNIRWNLSFDEEKKLKSVTSTII